MEIEEFEITGANTGFKLSGYFSANFVVQFFFCRFVVG